VCSFVGDDRIVIIDPGFFNMEPNLEAADLVKPLASIKAATAAVQERINEGRSLDQIKQEKVLAKLDYLEQGQARGDAYIERLPRRTPVPSLIGSVNVSYWIRPLQHSC